MLIFLLSGLFCCLSFSVAIFLAVWAGACFFLLFGRGRAPRPNSKKKKNTTPPLPSVFFFLLFGRVVVFIFCCLGGGRVYSFAVWAGGVFILLLFGRGACLFSGCLGGWRVFFLLFGRGREPRPNSKKKPDPAQTAKKMNTPPPLPSVFFFAVWAGGRVDFFPVWVGGVSFLLFGPGACVVFAVWAGSCFFLLFGRGAC